MTPSRNDQSATYVFYGERGFLDALEAGDRRDVQVVHGQLASGDDFVGRAQRRFHHAAGVGEDVGRAGRQSQRGIHLLVGQTGESRCPAARIILPSSRVVSTTSTSRAPLASISGPLAFELLGRAGHDRGDEDLLRLQAQLVGVVGLGQAPNICCGDLQVDRLGSMSGWKYSTNMIQPGEQLVNIGRATCLLLDQRLLQPRAAVRCLPR